MGEATDRPATTELLEVAFRFGVAVTGLATGTEPLRHRLAATWTVLGQVDGALSGLWPEPHVPADLTAQIHDLLARLTAAGPVEATLAALDDRELAALAQQVTALAFALHQTLGTAEGPVDG